MAASPGQYADVEKRIGIRTPNLLLSSRPRIQSPTISVPSEALARVYEESNTTTLRPGSSAIVSVGGSGIELAFVHLLVSK